MSPFLTMEIFLKNHQHKLHKIFHKVSLDHEFDFANQISLLKTMDVEISYTQKVLKEMGDQNLISSIYTAICYSNYLELIEQKRDIVLDSDFFSYKVLQDFMERLTNHQNLCQRDGKLYESRTRSDIRFYAESKRIGAFIEFFKKTGFDDKKYNYSYLFLILFWVRLEILVSKMDGFVKVIKQNGIEIHLIQDPRNLEADLVSFLNLDMMSSYKECINCYRAYHYLNPMFVHNQSEAMQFFASLSRKDMIKKIQAKGGKGKGETGKQLVEITKFFWEKCRNEDLENTILTIDNFSDALHCAINDEECNNGSIRKIKNKIIGFNEFEKIEFLKKSKAKPKAIAARLVGIKY